jgi:hypothetical protein
VALGGRTDRAAGCHLAIALSLAVVAWRAVCPHAAVQRYLNRSGESGIVAYEVGPAGIAVQFADGSIYVYDVEHPGRKAVSDMKRLARAGRGLSTYISQNVRDNYAKKLR